MPAARPRAGALLDLGDAQAGVFLVEPDGVESADEGEHLDELGRAELAEGEDADEAA